jgi:hypothetical protein
MNELLLVLAVVAVIAGTKTILKAIRKPTLFYINIALCLALVLLIWLAGTEGKMTFKWILTAAALGSIFTEVKQLVKFKQTE